jgi:hypothetical protein
MNASGMLPGAGSYMPVYDAATASGMAFLNGELEKRDPKLYEPLKSVTWPRDMPVKTGGGWVDYTSNAFVNYGISNPNHGGIIGTQSNAIPVVQADFSKDLYKAFPWANIMVISFVDMEKLNQIGRSIDEVLDKGIRLNWDKSLDLNAYQGVSALGTYGLVNNPNITATSAATGAASSKLWKNKTPDEILYDINLAIETAWAASEYDLTGMPNQINIPPEQYADIVSRKMAGNADKSILTYLLENNIAKNQGVDITIEPSRWCKGVGTGSTDRLIAYVNDEDRVHFDITVPLSRRITQPSVMDGGYVTLYMGQYGEVKFLYTQCALYVDGI